ncbi:MAG: DUF4333 domain-containing protein [Solirubrobacterales bacterium]
MRRVSVLILASAALLTACGESTIKPEGAEQSVVDVVSKQTGFHPKDVSCPSDVEAEVGGTFECEFTGPEGAPYTAHMKIVEVDGEEVLFQVDSRPRGK